MDWMTNSNHDNEPSYIRIKKSEYLVAYDEMKIEVRDVVPKKAYVPIVFTFVVKQTLVRVLSSNIHFMH